jgi:methylmalonyl-CoA mutase cobalamin-binding domain/chain
VIVGVNKYKLKTQDAVDILRHRQRRKVRDGQIARLKQIRASATRKVQAALDALTAAAEKGDGNLLDLSIQAMRLRATVGEVSDALEKVFGRHRADTQKVTGVYAAAMTVPRAGNSSRPKSPPLPKQQGRRPRVMISKLGQDGHDRGAKVVATAFADLGFDVDMGPLFQTPEECARQAIENDVHAVGVSTLAAGHKTLVPAIIDELKKQGADDIIVFVGGVIPQQDYEFLYEAGVKGIYGPGTPIPPAPRTCWSRSARRLPRNELCRGRSWHRWPGPAPCHRQGHHAARIHPGRPPRAGRCAAHGAAAAHGPIIPPGHQRRAGGGQEHLHRGAGPVPDRAGPPRGGADHRPVVSTVSGGSILGDKTRMEKLSVHERAYIRPSPSSGTLGGVAEKTREAMLVCEAAGYDVVIVETVGVGQSETAVAGMTDMFVLMQLPNAGDDLQAIKKGVMELADLVVINKADIDADAATRAQAQITSALRLLGQHGRPDHAHHDEKIWHPQVIQLSALQGTGVDRFWAAVTDFRHCSNRQRAARCAPPAAGAGLDVGAHRRRAQAGLPPAPAVRELLPP